MELIDIIKNRRSVRKYSSLPIAREAILNLIDAAGYAPSGKNLQPWRFVVVGGGKEKEQITELSNCKLWLKDAPYFIIVFLDNRLSYNRIKDLQAIGACIQNILLLAHAQNMGSCWVGDIMKQGEKIKTLLNINQDSLELMALIAIGQICDAMQKTITRRKVEDNILLWITDEGSYDIITERKSNDEKKNWSNRR